MSKKRKSQQSRGLSFESLESRYALAGDVNVVLSGNTLKITGDAAANDIRIIQDTATKTLRVEGIGTNVHLKGGAGAAFQEVIIDDLAKLTVNIKMLAGDDNVQVGQFAGDTVTVKSLNIDMGAGVDSVHVLNTHVTGNSANILLGNNSQDEHDTLDVEQCDFAGNVKVVAGGGQDDVFFTQNDVHKQLLIDAGKGDDFVVVQQGAMQKVRVQLGDGTNSLTAQNLTSTDFSVTGGAGSDTVNVSFLSSPKVTVKLGNGNDTLNADHLIVSSKLALDGGGGTDGGTLHFDNSLVPANTQPKHFETLTIV